MFRDGDSAQNRIWYFAQVHSYFPSTYANNFQVMKMCSALARNGMGTTLVVPRRFSTKRAIKKLQTSLWKFYGVSDNFEIAWLPFPYPILKFQRTVHALIGALYALGIKASLVYTRSEWVAILLARLGIPTVLEVHHFEGGLPQRMAFQGASRYLSFTGLVCVSKALADKLMELGVPESKVVVAPDGVDLEGFEPRLSRSEARTTLDLPLDRKIVCHLGSIYQGRGIETLLESAGKLPDVSFLLVGGRHEDGERYQNMIRELNIQNLHFTGIIPNREVPVYLYAADVLVMPYTAQTVTHQYMSPMKMFEYMASGRPIVASDFPVLREVLRPDENAVLVPPANAEALTGSIQRLLADPGLSERLGAQALRDVGQYTWDCRAGKVLDFIRERQSGG